MRQTPLTITLASLLVAACGGAAADLPDESTLQIQAPDEAASEQPLCAGDDHYRGFLKHEIEELNESAKAYVELYRLGRKVAKFNARADGKMERKFSGARGSITIVSTEADDGSTVVTISAAAKGNEDSERLLLEGTVAADGLSGGWKIFGKDGAVVRTVTWTKTEGGDLVAHWKNEKNGKTADYSRTGDAAVFKLTNPSGQSLEIRWSIATKVGNVAVLNATGAVTVKKCWDATFCNAECAE